MEQNAKENFFRNRARSLSIIAIVLIPLLGFGAYIKGYRLTSGVSLGKVGYLSMNIPLPQTSIFIDQSKKIITTKDNEEVRIPFSPKEHSVIISKEGYYPWKKDFNIPSSEEIKLIPLFISVNASGQIITKIDPEYTKLRNTIITSPVPTFEKPVISADKSVKIWVADNGIVAEINKEIVHVVDSDTSIRNISFYKDRNDAVMFSTSNAVYVIEIDRFGQQNFLPIYKGQKPSFIATNPGFIYVLDGENLLQILI